MANYQVFEPFNDQPNVIPQTYRDLTFLFGPPNGERYEMLVATARYKEESFSSVYRAYMEEIFASFEEESVLDYAFSGALGEDIKINEVFPTYQLWLRRKDKFEKFYLSPDDESVEIPAIMVFPPKFTLNSGSSLNINVDMGHANLVSAILGQSLQPDWIEVNGVFAEGGADNA